MEGTAHWWVTVDSYLFPFQETATYSGGFIQRYVQNPRTSGKWWFILADRENRYCSTPEQIQSETVEVAQTLGFELHASGAISGQVFMMSSTQ